MKRMGIFLILSMLFSTQLFASTASPSQLEDEAQFTIASDSESEPYEEEEPQPSDDEPSDSEDENPEL